MYNLIKTDNLKEFLQINSNHKVGLYFSALKNHKTNDKRFQNFYFQLLQKTKNLNTDKIDERLYAFKHNIIQKPKCPICGKEVKFLSYYLGYSSTCSVSCGLKNRYSNTQNLISANQKRQKTNLQKYGHKGVNINAKEITTNFYNKQKEQYQSITQLYTKNEVYQLLNTKRYNYKQYLGKGKIRKLKKDNLCLYKSIIEHTKEFKDKIKHYTFSASLLIAGQYNFDVTTLYCKCGANICFDPYKPAMIENGFCNRCVKPGPDIEKFKLKYGQQNYKKQWAKFCKQKNKKFTQTINKNQKDYGITYLRTASKISMQFFKEIYNRLKDKTNIHTHFLNQELMIPLTEEDIKLLNENGIEKYSFFLDFCQNNKVIQFNGVYWHRNSQKQDELRKKILEENHNMKVLFVDENQYYKNKQNVINECINFLQD